MDEPKISLSRNDTLMPARLTEFTPVSTSAAVNATHRDARQTNSAPTGGSTKSLNGIHPFHSISW